MVSHISPEAEYAMCFECYFVIGNSLSEKSRLKMDEYIESNSDLEKRYESNLRKFGLDINPWLSECMINKTAKEKLDEYQIVGQFDGNFLIFGLTPILLGGAALDKMVNLLSPETVEVLNDLSEKFFPIPPEFNFTPDDRKLLII